MAKQPLSLLVYGPPKIGKSTFANTAPAPRLIIDFESAAHWLKGKKKAWDPTTEPVPEYDGTWDMVYVSIQDYHDLSTVTNILLGGQHPFRSVIIDSLSEAQVLIKDDTINKSKMQIQDWGELAELTGRFARDLRNMLGRRDNPVEYIILIATEKIVRDAKTHEVVEIKPSLQGSTQAVLPYLYDITAYYYLSNDLRQSPDGDNTKNAYVKTRHLFTESNSTYTTGSRVPNLEGNYSDITFPELVEKAYNQE